MKNMQTRTCVFAMFAGVALADVALADKTVLTPGGEAVWASREDSVVFEVEAGQTAAQTGAIHAERGAWLEKTGEGEMVLPAGNMVGTDGAALRLRQGVVTVADGEKPSLDKPTEVLSKAAVWLDASKNVIEADTPGTGRSVVEWRDCRETSTTAPFAHYHGYAVKMSGAGKSVAGLLPQTVSGALGSAVDFRGYGSHCSLLLQKPESSVAPTQRSDSAQMSATDVFIVHSVTRENGNANAPGGYGFLFGAVLNDYHPSSAAQVVGKNLIRSEFDSQDETRWWLDGTEINAMATSASLGSFVFDMRHYNVLPTVYGLYANADMGSRCGGDLVYEALVFTNRLTEVEHAQVRRYLTDKYGKTPTSDGVYGVMTAAGTTVNVAASSSGVGIQGLGAVNRLPGSAAVLSYVPGGVYGGVLSLVADDANAPVLRQDVTLDLPCGGVLSAETVRYGTKVSLDSTNAAVLRKTGVENVRIASVPQSVSRVEVDGGVLTVAPDGMPVDATVPGPRQDATIADADFQAVPQGDMKGHQGGNPTTRGGWTCVYSKDKHFNDSYALIHAYEGGTYWFDTPTKPRGDVYLAMRGDVMLYTTVDVPDDGRYDVSFDAFHVNGSPFSSLSVWIGDTLDSLECMGGAIQFSRGVWERKSVRTAFLRRGAGKILALKRETSYDGSDDSGAGSHYMLDNLRMTFVPDVEKVVPVPNGTFERLTPTATLAVNTGVANRKFGDYEATGWAFAQPVGAVDAATGVALYGSKNSPGVGQVQCANGTMAGCGDAQLLISAVNAPATTTFRVPKGVWHLRAAVAPWRKSKPANTYDVGQLQARVRVAGRDVTLGSVELPGLMAMTAVWPTPIVADAEGTEVTLELACLVDRCGALVDNVELVASGAASVVADGDFEGSSWTYDTSARESGTPRERVAAVRSEVIRGADVNEYMSPLENYRGAAGGYCGVICDSGAICQTVVVPTDGRYRLTYYTRGRYNGGADVAIRYNYMNNAFRFLLVSGAESVVLDETRVASTNWVQHTAVVAARAGTYEFRIQGLNVPTVRGTDTVLGGGWDKRGFVDGVSLVKVDDLVVENRPFSEDARISVAQGAKMRLDFRGTNRVGQVKLGGHVASGFVSAKTHPEYFLGEGVLWSESRGLMILLR